MRIHPLTLAHSVTHRLLGPRDIVKQRKQRLFKSNSLRVTRFGLSTTRAAQTADADASNFSAWLNICKSKNLSTSGGQKFVKVQSQKTKKGHLVGTWSTGENASVHQNVSPCTVVWSEPANSIFAIFWEKRLLTLPAGRVFMFLKWAQCASPKCQLANTIS